jgi:3-oxoadipate enol-lactonase
MPRAPVNGINIYYEVHGNGEPLLLIAGMGADHRSWFPQTMAFRKRYRVITFDGRGMGKSDTPTGLYTFRTLAEDVIGLMDHLRIDKAHMLGESLGGIVAQEVAILFPHRLMKLVLANTSPGTGVGMQIHPELMEAYGGDSASTDFDATKVDIGKAMRAMISLSFNSRLYRLAMGIAATLYVRTAGLSGMAEQIKAISNHSTLDRLHLIQSPTLVMVGTRDRIVPPAMSEILVGRIPGARLVKIDNGPHALNVEMRRRFNAEVLAFLNGVRE